MPSNLVDEIFVGSKSHKLEVGTLDHLYQKIYEEGIAENADDYRATQRLGCNG